VIVISSRLCPSTPSAPALKDVDRILRRQFGPSDDSYLNLKRRLIEQLLQADQAEERVIQQRVETLTAHVRAELEARQDEMDAYFQKREADVAAREEEASPSCRAGFFGAGAGLVLAADVLLRLVA